MPAFSASTGNLTNFSPRPTAILAILATIHPARRMTIAARIRGRESAIP